MGGQPTLKYHYSERYFTYFVEWKFGVKNQSFLNYVGYACRGQGVAERARGGRVWARAGRRQKPSGTDSDTCAGTVVCTSLPLRLQTKREKEPGGEFGWGGTSVKR